MRCCGSLRGDRFAATRNAALVGRFVRLPAHRGGVFLALQRGALFGGVWLALIGWFLSTAAEATLGADGVERSLHGVPVRDVMEPIRQRSRPNETVAELVNERMLRGEHRSYLGPARGGGLAGIVTLSDVGGVPRTTGRTPA